MKRPIIGISGTYTTADNMIQIKDTYLKAVIGAGGLPVLLPALKDEALIDAYLDEMDGLLLAGGGDVHPSYFGEEMIPGCGEPNELRDAFEMAIIPLALKRGMPMLGICRGAQMINVAMGGTLWQDIWSQLDKPKNVHTQEPPYSQPHHCVRFGEDSLFARITGAQEMMTNSMHHQAIKDLAPQLRAEGWAEDGTIEAIASEKGDILGVQFHPEYLIGENACAARLFDHFVEQAAAYRK